MVAITVAPQVMDREWKLAVSASARDLLGRVGPIRWPKPPAGLVAWRKPPWVEIRALVAPPWWRRVLASWWRRLRGRQQTQDSTGVDEAAASAVEEKLVAALAGLVPTPRPRVGAGELVVDYGETTRDQSPAWRARVVDQVSARLGTTYRAGWDRQHRRFILQPVPVLPHPIVWSEQVVQLQHLKLGPWVAAYGTDEDGHIVAWQPGDREPHAMFTGDPGTGKTESMKAAIDSLLEQGALVAIIDPKQQDFAEYLGRPGVICVATAVEDQVGALVDLEAEMMRRTSAKALARLNRQFPELLVGAEDARYHSDRRPPAQAAIDEVPLILVLDELTYHVAQVQEWWQRLAPAEKAEWGAEKARQAPMLTIPARIVALARAISMHALFGMQRPDANNFGGSTAMRDNIKHQASMGRQSRIGSEMQWGDGRTGSEVEINNVGEGVSNGLRLDPATGQRLGRGTPGRFKAWYAADIAETAEFWERVAAVAPDASLVRLPHVSDAARDPRAAAAALRAKAYEEYHGLTPLPTGAADQETDPDGDEAPAAIQKYLTAPEEPAERPALSVVESTLDDDQGMAADDDQAGEQEVTDPLLHAAAELVVSQRNGSAAMLQRELKVGYERGRQLMSDLEALGVVGPVQGRKARTVKVRSLPELHTLLRSQRVPPPVPPPTPSLRLVTPEPALADPSPVEQALADELADLAVAEIDESGMVWEPVPATVVEEGDVVQFGDISSAVVLDAPGVVVDDFDGAEVIRLVLDLDGGEEVVDLSEDDVIHRRAVR